MHEIKCPHCGQTFTIDEAGYADIARQVRDNEFDKQLRERLALADQEKNKAVELAETKAAGELRASADAGMGECVLDLGMENAWWQQQIDVVSVDLESDRLAHCQADDIQMVAA